MNNYYNDSDVTARYGYKVAEDPNCCIRRSMRN